MQLRFNKPKSFFQDWAAGSPMKGVLVSNLSFREFGDLSVVSGPATLFTHFLSELSGQYELDDLIQDPIIS